MLDTKETPVKSYRLFFVNGRSTTFDSNSYLTVLEKFRKDLTIEFIQEEINVDHMYKKKSLQTS